jgi:hypothetical protein
MKGTRMDKSVRLLYVNILGFNKNPKQIFNDWNKFKLAAWSSDHEVPTYPEYVRMAVKYEVK